MRKKEFQRTVTYVHLPASSMLPACLSERSSDSSYMQLLRQQVSWNTASLGSNLVVEFLSANTSRNTFLTEWKEGHAPLEVFDCIQPQRCLSQSVCSQGHSIGLRVLRLAYTPCTNPMLRGTRPFQQFQGMALPSWADSESDRMLVCSIRSDPLSLA
eukprot:229768-Rhodomonas_salina.5